MMGVDPSTIRRWIRDGRVDAYKTPTHRGQWRVPAEEVRKLRQDAVPEDGDGQAVLYVRVREEDKGLADKALVHLTQYATRHGYQVHETVKDIAPGVDGGREGLEKLREYIRAGKVDTVIVERIDRLTLVGGEDFRRWADELHVAVEEAGVCCEEAERRYAREIVEDLFFTLADALALAADREQAEQAAARALSEVWRFLDVG